MVCTASTSPTSFSLFSAALISQKRKNSEYISTHIQQLTRYAARCLFLWPHIQKQQEEHALAVAISRRGRPKLIQPSTS
jgi:hypothetical protein